MYRYFVDRANLRAVAQYLIDARQADVSDVLAVKAMLKHRLKETFAVQGSSVNFDACACVCEPVFCMPVEKPGGRRTDVMLNLLIRSGTNGAAGWEFERLA